MVTGRQTPAPPSVRCDPKLDTIAAMLARAPSAVTSRIGRRPSSCEHGVAAGSCANPPRTIIDVDQQQYSAMQISQPITGARPADAIPGAEGGRDDAHRDRERRYAGRASSRRTELGHLTGSGAETGSSASLLAIATSSSCVRRRIGGGTSTSPLVPKIDSAGVGARQTGRARAASRRRSRLGDEGGLAQTPRPGRSACPAPPRRPRRRADSSAIWNDFAQCAAVIVERLIFSGDAGPRSRRPDAPIARRRTGLHLLQARHIDRLAVAEPALAGGVERSGRRPCRQHRCARQRAGQQQAVGGVLDHLVGVMMSDGGVSARHRRVRWRHRSSCAASAAHGGGTLLSITGRSSWMSRSPVECIRARRHQQRTSRGTPNTTQLSTTRNGRRLFRRQARVRIASIGRFGRAVSSGRTASDRRSARAGLRISSAVRSSRCVKSDSAVPVVIKTSSRMSWPDNRFWHRLRRFQREQPDFARSHRALGSQRLKSAENRRVIRRFHSGPAHGGTVPNQE